MGLGLWGWIILMVVPWLAFNGIVLWRLWYLGTKAIPSSDQARTQKASHLRLVGADRGPEAQEEAPDGSAHLTYVAGSGRSRCRSLGLVSLDGPEYWDQTPYLRQ